MRGELFSVEAGSDNILSKLGKNNVVVLFENWVVVLDRQRQANKIHLDQLKL